MLCFGTNAELYLCMESWAVIIYVFRVQGLGFGIRNTLSMHVRRVLQPQSKGEADTWLGRIGSTLIMITLLCISAPCYSCKPASQQGEAVTCLEWRPRLCGTPTPTPTAWWSQTPPPAPGRCCAEPAPPPSRSHRAAACAFCKSLLQSVESSMYTVHTS